MCSQQKDDGEDEGGRGEDEGEKVVTCVHVSW